MKFAQNKQVVKTVFDNGLTLVCLPNKRVRSVSLGAFVKTGSRYETPTENGAAHFIEHLLFRGSENYSALELVQLIEETGGSINAYTTKEYTAYFAQTLDLHLKLSIKILSDLICRPVFNTNDINLEKEIIKEEILSIMDVPEEYLVDIFQEKVYAGSSLAQPILGAPQTVDAFDNKLLSNFYQKFYTSSNVVISAAGNFDQDELMEWVCQYFVFSNPNKGETKAPPPRFSVFDEKVNDAVHQVHLCVGTEGSAFTAEHRYEVKALETLLCGGMSSILFQELREKLGLAYAVNSSAEFFRDSGLLQFYVVTDPQKLTTVRSVIQKELDRLTKKGIGIETLDKIKTNLKGSMIISDESMTNRMFRIATDELYHQRTVSILEKINAIEKMTEYSLLSVAKNIFNSDKISYLSLQPK
jgi:predicted Zn-dependent peptidase